MTRLRPTVLAVCSLLALSACASTSTAPPGKTAGSPAVVATTPPTTAPTSTALTFPSVSAGEVARVTILRPGLPDRQLTWRVAGKGRYVVLFACTASRSAATVTYKVSLVGPRNTGPLLSSGFTTTCDGSVKVDTVVLRAGVGYVVDLSHSGPVTGAYAMIVPA